MTSSANPPDGADHIGRLDVVLGRVSGGGVSFAGKGDSFFDFGASPRFSFAAGVPFTPKIRFKPTS